MSFQWRLGGLVERSRQFYERRTDNLAPVDSLKTADSQTRERIHGKEAIER